MDKSFFVQFYFQHYNFHPSTCLLYLDNKTCIKYIQQ